MSSIRLLAGPFADSGGEGGRNDRRLRIVGYAMGGVLGVGFAAGVLSPVLLAVERH